MTLFHHRLVDACTYFCVEASIKEVDALVIRNDMQGVHQEHADIAFSHPHLTFHQEYPKCCTPCRFRLSVSLVHFLWWDQHSSRGSVKLLKRHKSGCDLTSLVSFIVASSHSFTSSLFQCHYNAEFRDHSFNTLVFHNPL